MRNNDFAANGFLTLIAASWFCSVPACWQLCLPEQVDLRERGGASLERRRHGKRSEPPKRPRDLAKRYEELRQLRKKSNSCLQGRRFHGSRPGGLGQTQRKGNLMALR